MTAGRFFGLGVALTVVLAVPLAARADDEAQYDQYGRRPPQPNNELSLPDPVLDPSWPMPEPGGPKSKPELLDRDEDRLDPLHEEAPKDEEPPIVTGRDALPMTAEELLRRGPAGDQQVPSLLDPPDGEDDRGADDTGDPAKE